MSQPVDDATTNPLYAVRIINGQVIVPQEAIDAANDHAKQARQARIRQERQRRMQQRRDPNVA